MIKLLFHGVGAYQSGQRFGPATWPHHDLLVIRAGHAAFQTSEGILSLQGGDAVLIPPGMEFVGEADASECLLWVIHFHADEAIKTQVTDLVEPELRIYRGGGRSEIAIKLMERLSQLYQGERRWTNLAEVYLTALLVDLHLPGSFPSRPHERWLMEVERFARGNLSKGIPIKLLADNAGFSVSHFRKLFLQRYGTSVGKFVQDLRHREAKTLLMQSTLSLKQVSAELGYSDPVAFSRSFTNRYGISPGQFRKQNPVA